MNLEYDDTPLIKMYLHGCEIHAPNHLKVAALYNNGKLIRTFFTEPKAKKGDALEQAMQYAKHKSPEDMEKEAKRKASPKKKSSTKAED